MPLRIKLRDGLSLDITLDYNQMESIWRQQEERHIRETAIRKTREWTNRNGVPYEDLFPTAYHKTAFINDASKEFSAHRDPDRAENELWDRVIDKIVTRGMAFRWPDDITQAVYDGGEPSDVEARVGRALTMLGDCPDVKFLTPQSDRDEFREFIGHNLQLGHVIALMKTFVWGNETTKGDVPIADA